MEDRPGKIFVGGLDFDINETEFEEIFSKFGKITEVLLKRDQQTNKSRGFGFITYENPADAKEAVKELDKQEVKGKMVHVDHAVKPGGGPGGDRGRGGFRGRGGPIRGMGGGFRGRGGFNDVGRGGGFNGRGGGGFRGRGAPRGMDRGRGFGGRGRGGERGGFSDRGGFDRGMRGGFSDDRRGPMSSQRRMSPDRGFGDRSVRRDDYRDSGVVDRDRYGNLIVSDRRPVERYTSSPPRTSYDRDRDVGTYRGDYSSSRDYSPSPRDYGSRDRVSSRDYGSSSRDLGITSRTSYDIGRDTLTSSYGRRDDYMATRDSSRDYISSSRGSPREYTSSSRDYDRLTSSRDYDSYRDRMSPPYSRGYGGSSPPRGRSPPPSRSAYSPPRTTMSRDLDRDRRDYSPGARRPSSYDMGPPMKRSRPDDIMPRMSTRDGPPRGIVRDPPMRENSRDSSRGGMSMYRR